MTWMRHQFNPKRHQLYIPSNIEKYKGNVPIVMRSGLEKRFANWCDKTNGVIWWSSETLAIPYYNPIKKRRATYYPDFIVKINTIDGEHIMVVEIKHEKETRIPAPAHTRSVKGKKYLLREQVTYIINDAKWNACIKYCERHGYEFSVVTNKTIDKLR